MTWDERDKLDVSAHYEPDYEILRAALNAMEKERDKAIMEGMALAKEKDGMQVEIDRLRVDIDAYRGSLGYAVPGDHDGRLSDGTYPVNGIAEANRQEIAALTAKVRAVEWEAC